MTELLDEAVARVRELPAADQDKAAAVLFELLNEHEEDYRLTDEQVEKVRQTQEGLRNGSVGLVPEEEMEEFWRRLGA